MPARKAKVARPAPALTLETFLPYRLNVAASLVSQGLARIYSQRHGIGIPEWRVIATLGEFGTMTAKAIGEHSHMHKTKVSRAVSVLTGRGWLMRRANANDLREGLLMLTAAGREVYADLAPIALDYARKIEAMIGNEDRAAFDRTLAAITAHAARLRDPDAEDAP